MDSRVSLDFLVGQVARAHVKKLNQELGKFGLHKGQPIMLLLLSKQDGIPQSELVHEMDITPATVSTMIKRLEKAGFVIRKRNAKDERISNVYLTDAGRSICSKLYNLQKEMEAVVFSGFSAEEKESIRSYLERILDNLL